MRDQFAAEAAQPGTTFVDVVTQPGIGPHSRRRSNFSLRDGSMTGRSQFTPTRGPEQFKDFGGNIGGTLIQGQHELLVVGERHRINTSRRSSTRRCRAGHAPRRSNIRQPFNRRELQRPAGRPRPHASNQTLRVGFNSNYGNAREPGHRQLRPAGARRSHRRIDRARFRVQEAGPIGRRAFINTRLSHTWQRFTTSSVTDAPTIVVQDAFTSGGAQQTADARLQHADARVRRRLRARHPLVARRRCRSTASGSRPPNSSNSLRHLHVQQPRGVRGGPAGAVHAVAWRSGSQLLATSRAPSIFRTTSTCGKASP